MISESERKFNERFKSMVENTGFYAHLDLIIARILRDCRADKLPELELELLHDGKPRILS